MNPHHKEVKVISIDREKAELHKSENAWNPKQKKEGVDEDAEGVYKAVKAILNKLTPQKFDKLTKQVLTLKIDNEEKLKGCIDILFEKAIDEPTFSIAYGTMAKYMTAIKVPSSKNPNEEVLFRNLLLNRCQREFEKDKSNDEDMERRKKEIESAPEEDKKRLIAEMNQKEFCDRRRSLGNIKFIGELFKLKMLTDKIMHDCIIRLLKASDAESLECLVKLLTTIGKELDIVKNKARMDHYFQQLDRFARDVDNVSSRVRFMIRDLFDLKSAMWVPRHEPSGPTTIDAIHKNAEHEEIERQALVQRLQSEHRNMPHGGQGGGGGGRGRRNQQQQGGAQGQTGEDGWNTVRQGNRIDPEKMRLTNPHQFDETTLQLGPQGRKSQAPSWGAGAGTRGGNGSKDSSREKEGPGAPSNRFSALSGEGVSNYQDARGSRGVASRGGALGGRSDSRDGKGRSLQGRGARGGRASMEQEREAAIAAARNINIGGPSSRNQSRESSRDGRRSDSQEVGRQQQRPPIAAATTGPALATKTEDVKRKSKALIEEYLSLKDLKEAAACTKEIDPSRMNVFVVSAIEMVLEKSEHGRFLVGQLLHDLIKNGDLDMQHYVDGLMELLGFAEDMIIDIPQIMKYYGQIVGPMIQDRAINIKFLATVVRPLPDTFVSKFLACVLNDAASRLGHDGVGELWRASGLSWPDLLGADKTPAQIQAILDDNNLGYTMGQAEPKSPDGKHLGPEQIQKELDRLVIKEGAENMDIIDWIFSNVGEAHLKEAQNVRAIVTSVCMSSMDSGNQVNTEKLKKRMNLIQRFIDHDDKLELQALFAVQALVHKLEHPAGVLRSLFDTLYDEDVISEEAFYSWYSSEEEMAGKGVAASSVKQFFTWLQNADEVAEN